MPRKQPAATARAAAARAAAEQVGQPRWLDEAEMQTWLPLLRVVQLLPQSLDRQLREQAGINHVYYMLLSILSGQPEHRLPLTELARLAAMSQSRASHAVTSLEQRGWVERHPCPTDRRVQFIVLNAQGRQVLTDAAPGHVAEVRRLVFDQLDPDDLAHLRRVALKLVAVLDEQPTPPHGAPGPPRGTDGRVHGTDQTSRSRPGRRPASHDETPGRTPP